MPKIKKPKPDPDYVSAEYIAALLSVDPQSIRSGRLLPELEPVALGTGGRQILRYSVERFRAVMAAREAANEQRRQRVEGQIRAVGGR